MDRINSCLKVINLLRELPMETLRNTNYEIKKTLALFPPAKNENKFPYGLIIEQIMINLMRKIGVATHLDREHKVGSEYKNDVKIFEDKFSVKASANIGSAITLINKNNVGTHCVIDINLITIFSRDGIITVFPLSEVEDGYIENKDACVRLKGGFYKKYIKETQYEFKLPELTEEQKIHIDSLKDISYAEYLYKTFVETPYTESVLEIT